MRIFIILAIILFAAVAVIADQTVPDANVQNILNLTRDYLWQMDDYFWHRGEYERCIAMMRLITKVEPHDIEAYGGGAWLMQNQLRDDEAEAYLLEGLNNNPKDSDMYFELGYYYYMHERFPEAISYLELATMLGASPTVWHLLAHSYELSGDVDEALNIWTMLEPAEPDSNVPGIQIERILSGGPASKGPEMARHAREERLKERKKPGS